MSNKYPPPHWTKVYASASDRFDGVRIERRVGVWLAWRPGEVKPFMRAGGHDWSVAEFAQMVDDVESLRPFDICPSHAIAKATGEEA